MIQWIRGAAAALLAALLVALTIPGAAASGAVPVTEVSTYTYDRPFVPSAQSDSRYDRGPPLAAARVGHQRADDHRSSGSEPRLYVAATPATHDYDPLGRLAPVDPNIAYTVEATHVAAGSQRRVISSSQFSRVAANTGPRALPVGPWGQKVVDARGKLPSSWGPGRPNAKGVGTRWSDPASQGNGIRVDQGIPGSSFASQQVDHVVVRSGGRILGPDGKPIVGSLSQNPQAHIPYSDWLGWSSWSTP